MIIGLTGQTGAGKSTVCNYLKEKGFTVIDCDIVAREVTEIGSPALIMLADVFGEEIIREDGSLDRKLLAKKAFSSKKNTKLLNSITHPLIFNLIKDRLVTYNNENVILDAPTLFESGVNKICDKIISVVADKDIRFNRIISRDNLTCDEAETRMRAQKDEEFFMNNSNAVIHNNLDSSKLTFEIEKALNEIGVK